MDPIQRERASKQLRIGGRVFLWLMLLGLPLAMHRGYFDITETKTVFFVVTAGSFLCFRLVMALQYGFSGERLRSGELLILALALIALLSSALSGFFRDSFLGLQGRYQGAGMMGLYALLFPAVRRSSWREEDIRLPLLAGLALTGALAVLNHLGADPLGLSAKLIASDRGRYISTLGNINFAGAYFTLTLSASAVWLLSAKKRGERLLLSIVCLLGLWAVMACRSESSLLGLGLTFLLLPLLLGKDPQSLRRWPWLLPGIAGGMQLYRLLCLPREAYLSALTRLLLRPSISAVLALAGLILGLVLYKEQSPALRRFLRVYAGALIAALLLGALALALLNTLWRALPLGALEGWLRFSDAWGTDRGAIWARCLAIYKSFPPLQKLLGGGCGILPRLDARRRLFPDAVLDSAHCEYWQILINWGLLGLTAYLGWLACAVRPALRGEVGGSPALPAGALAYAVQAGVNIAQAPGICLFVLLLSLMAAGERKNTGA